MQAESKSCSSWISRKSVIPPEQSVKLRRCAIRGREEAEAELAAIKSDMYSREQGGLTSAAAQIRDWFSTEHRMPCNEPAQPFKDSYQRKSKYVYFAAAGINPRAAGTVSLTYEEARSKLKQIKFDRKNQASSASAASGLSLGNAEEGLNANFTAIVDSQCEARRTSASRWLSFVENSFWNGARPLELARMLVANGLFLLSKRHQFAVKLTVRTRVEQLVSVSNDYEGYPAPKVLKVRCAFCKRVFEVPYTSSFAAAAPGSGEETRRQFSAVHLNASSHWASLCAIASQLRLQHERRSPSCPMVVGVNSDDVRVETPEEYRNQVRSDPFYKKVAFHNRAEYDSRAFSSTSVESGLGDELEDGDDTLSESPVTDDVETELLHTRYRVMPQTSYSDAVILCDDDLTQFGSNYEFELNGRARFGDPTAVYDEYCRPIQPDNPISRILYDSLEDFDNLTFAKDTNDTNTRSSTRLPDDAESDALESENITRLPGPIGDAGNSFSRRNRNNSLVDRCDEESEIGYESLLESFAARGSGLRQQPCFAPFIAYETRLETFESGAQVDVKRIELRDYLALYALHENDRKKCKSVEVAHVPPASVDEHVEQADFCNETANSLTLEQLRRKLGDSDWNAAKRPLFERLAEAGFFSLRRPEAHLCDVCVCFWCGLTIGNWHDRADAFVEHARHLKAANSCAYLFYRRGRQFILDARSNYPQHTAQTVLFNLSEVPDFAAAPSRLLRALRIPEDCSPPQTSAAAAPAKRQPAENEPPYDALLSFRSSAVDYRVEEREIRARKDLRIVRNLVFVCGSQPLAVSFAMERRLKCSNRDFANARHFLESQWDLEARLRTLRIGDFQEFLRRFNAALPSNLRDETAVTSVGIQQGLDDMRSISSNEQAQHSEPGADSASRSVSSRSTVPTVSATTRSSTSSGLCVACHSNVPNTVVLPCGHLVLCNNCEHRKPSRCPICNSIVQNTMRVYNS